MSRDPAYRDLRNGEINFRRVFDKSRTRRSGIPAPASRHLTEPIVFANWSHSTIGRKLSS